MSILDNIIFAIKNFIKKKKEENKELKAIERKAYLSELKKQAKIKGKEKAQNRVNLFK